MDPIDPDSLMPTSVEVIADHAETLSDILDEYYGRDFSKEHSQFLGQLVLAASIHGGAMLIAQRFQEIAEAIRCK